MRHHEHSLALAPPHAQQFIPQIFTGKGIQSHKRLIQKQKRRVEHKRARQRHPLRHPARKVARQSLFKALKPHQGNHFRHTAADFGFGQALQFQWQGDVGFNCPPRHQIGFLEHQPNPRLAAPQSREEHPAARRAQNPRHHAHQRALPTARRANQSHKFLLADGKSHVGDGFQFPIIGGENHAHVLKAQKRLHGATAG